MADDKSPKFPLNQGGVINDLVGRLKLDSAVDG